MKPFLFYVGNPRAGSTWLYGELKNRGDCEFGKVKEPFLFHGPLFGITQEEYFLAYQHALKNPNVNLLGDFSTSNGYATKEQLFWFKEQLGESIKVLPVMTLRDPITQILSLSAMKKEKISLPDFEQHILSWEETINNCEEVFGGIHIQFYETMFTEECMKKLCTYLSIDYFPMRLENKVFSFGDKRNLTDNEKFEIFETYPFYKKNYNFALKKFGKEFIESIWWDPYK